MDEQEKIDRVIVKIWDMAKGDINNEPCVRKATLEWAREELGWKPPKPKPISPQKAREKCLGRLLNSQQEEKPRFSPGFVDE